MSFEEEAFCTHGCRRVDSDELASKLNERTMSVTRRVFQDVKTLQHRPESRYKSAKSNYWDAMQVLRPTHEHRLCGREKSAYLQRA